MDILVPWHEQTLFVRALYMCRSCELRNEEYRAINNIPKHAHLCKSCWINDENKTEYMKVELGNGA